MTYKEFLGVWELAFVTSGGFFFEFLTLPTLGDRKFLNSILFSMIFNVLDVPIGGVHILFGHQK
jgi:hypothetical protein